MVGKVLTLFVTLGVLCCQAQEVGEALRLSRFSGGTVVHLGCRDASRALALQASDHTIVQALCREAADLIGLRGQIQKAGAYGPVSAIRLAGSALPYIDNTVNLLVVDDSLGVPREEMMRVLTPGGTLCVADAREWSVAQKPRPEDLDEWTHYLHDAAGTMVGRDGVVGPPRRFQWVGAPKWLRNHEFMSSMHAMVSAGGRVFYIIDEGLRNHIFLPPRWTLIARDAFNGAILWKRPIKDWQPHIWPMKSGPGHMPRRLVAVDDVVYVTLGFREPVTALNAATGETVRTYEGTRSAEEICIAQGILYLLVDPAKKPVGFREERTYWLRARSRANSLWGWSRERPPRVLMAVDARTGGQLWRHQSNVAPLTLTVGPDHVFFYDGASVVALSKTSGEAAWGTELPVKTSPATGYTHRMAVSDGVLLFCHNASVNALETASGRQLWKGGLRKTGHNSPNDMFIINGLVWSANTGKSQTGGTSFEALDLRTGEVRRSFTADTPDVYFMHQRCYPGRATEKWIMTSGTGTEFLAVDGPEKVDIHHHVRGSCIYGLMPANGLLYKPPDSCACHYQSKVTHFCALAPGTSTVMRPTPDSARLQRGPAYDGVGKAPAPDGRAGHWTTYRGTASRSGASMAELPGKLSPGWRTRIGGDLTAPTFGPGTVYVAAVDRQTLYALDADSGQKRWSFTASGRIDSPPTLHGSTVLFGSADGHVYCLRRQDGELAWRYQGAPAVRNLLSHGQFESLWPIHGSVLVHNGVVFCVAGRNMFFDGGMRLLRLDAATGEMLSETVLDEIDPETGKNLQLKMPGKAMPVANPDILSCDGKRVYMGAQVFDLMGKRVTVDAPKGKESAQLGPDRHLFCPTGFLDGAWFHRSYMMFGTTGGEGHGEYTRPAKLTPVGRLLALGPETVYGFRASVYNNTMQPRPGHFLFAAQRNKPEGETEQAEEAPPRKPGKVKKKSEAPSGRQGWLKYRWQQQDIGVLPNAMALAGETLFIAGAPDVADEGRAFGVDLDQPSEVTAELRKQDEAWRGGQGAILRSVAASDGTALAEHRLDSLPVWDGMAVDQGKLVVSLKDGSVVCYTGSAGPEGKHR